MENKFLKDSIKRGINVVDFFNIKAGVETKLNSSPAYQPILIDIIWIRLLKSGRNQHQNPNFHAH